MKRARILITGKPNVGKSSLFNRLIGRKRALVHNLPGVTRDSLTEQAKWFWKTDEIELDLVDTGGIGGETFNEEISQQVQYAVEHSEILVTVIDCRSGIGPLDKEVINQLRKWRRKDQPWLTVFNKVDTPQTEVDEGEASRLGLNEFYFVSAEHGLGIEDLRQGILQHLADMKLLSVIPEGTPEKRNGITSLAIVGRPNVGKSTLFNALLGRERSIVSPIAGTTTDQVDEVIHIQDQPYCLIDTAGVRKKSKTEQGVEVLSVLQTKKALEKADVALLVIDAEVGPTDQDEKIAGMIESARCSVILLVNKWDTQKGQVPEKEAAKWIRGKLGFLGYAPLLFISAKKKAGLDQLGDLLAEVLRQRYARIPTKDLTDWIKVEMGKYNPKRAKVYTTYFIPASEKSGSAPKLVFQVNDPRRFHYSVERHLINGVRDSWGFMGTPIRVTVRKSGRLKAFARSVTK